MTAIGERIERVRRRMALASERAGRDPNGVLLVAVTKGFGVDACRHALQAGVGDLGENRAQEYQEKAAALGDRVRWHFVGHLQTNKVRPVAGIVSLIHSIDRPSIAAAVDRRARDLGITQDVLVEVNLSREPQKSGVEPARALSLAEDVAALDNVAVKGLMTMPPLAEQPEAARPYFKQLASLRAEMLPRLPDAVQLSMGMTRDFEVAIEEGATIVRVGEAIFGPRRR